MPIPERGNTAWKLPWVYFEDQSAFKPPADQTLKSQQSSSLLISVALENKNFSLETIRQKLARIFTGTQL